MTAVKVEDDWIVYAVPSGSLADLCSPAIQVNHYLARTAFKFKHIKWSSLFHKLADKFITI